MCLGIPGKILALKGKKAKIKQENHSRWVDVSALDQELKPGDYLLLYQNTAINKIEPRQAEEILNLI